MRAMRVHAPRAGLVSEVVAVPEPGPRQLLLRVCACGVCRTDLHIADGELAGGRLPVTPGHEIVGCVAAAGPGAERFRVGDRVGVPWLGGTCGTCRYCRSGRENLCDGARFTGFHLDGGYAEFALADEAYCLAIPEAYADEEAAPLLCAGLIGYRTLAMAGDAQAIGIYGFGAAAHLVAQVARHQGRRVFAFTRPGDAQAQAFALECGAHWAGASGATPPEPLDAALIFAPVGALVPAALAQVVKGGTVVCGGIHMSEIPTFAYSLLWGERSIRSVANLTRADGEAFMRIAAQARLRVQTVAYGLAQANEALDDLRAGRLAGAAVLRP
ncbi:MAG: zinc-dependent alcohol dehydrogenase family protein [Proteobacteria bacterium]|nr:zinc-dependent alcohol dehydrogenase family protein [Pseudomonadota bacterium]